MEDYLDELFDLQPIIHEIYPSYNKPLIFSNNISKKTHDQYHTKITPSTTAYDHSTSFSEFENSKHVLGYSTTTAAVVDVVVAAPDDDLYKMVIRDNSIKSQNIINFSSEDGNINIEQYYHHDASSSTGGNKRVIAANRTPSQAQEHLMSERKRREKLNQLFIHFSKLIPGLKKLDKASLLEDAADYLKSLQERVSALEEEVVNRSSSSSNIHEDIASEDVAIISASEILGVVVPEINIRISNRTVLIKVLCKKQNGLLSKIPCEMENIHLSVTDMRMMPFGDTALHITILAQMQSEFCFTVNDINDHMEMTVFNYS